MGEGRRAVGSDTVVVLPVGPACRREFVADTLESIRAYAPGARIIVVDDSRNGTGASLCEEYGADLVTARAHGLFGGLYLNLSEGFAVALERPFRVLLRLDTDALVTGSDFEAKAIGLFDADPTLGSLGSFRVGYDRAGIRDTRWARHRIWLFLTLRSWRRPRAAALVVSLIRRARANGYRLGESIMGGAAVYRYEALQALASEGLLGREELAQIGVHEDHIFGLCLLATGYHLGEFGDGFDDLPMGVDWSGLPASPSELLARGKSIVHSTKRYADMDEGAIRAEFRVARGGDRHTGLEG